MDSELDNMPEGARHAAQQIAELIELMKDQDKRILVLEKHVYVLLDRLDKNESNFLELVEIFKNSIIKIDQQALGMN